MDSIEIEGNERVTDGTVLAYLPVKSAMRLLHVDQAITALFATNLFSDVTIARNENRIVISVKENPIINRINIEGNDILTDERLLRTRYSAKTCLHARHCDTGIEETS